MDEGEYDDFNDNFNDDENALFDEENDALNNNRHDSEGLDDKNKILQSVWEKTDDEVKTKVRAKTTKICPKLTVIELTTGNGLPALKNIFDDNHSNIIKKSDPYEKLDIMMDKMECWAHNLYPKMNFDDCLEKIGKLGHTRAIKGMMRRLRFGVSLENNNEDVEEQENKQEHDGKLGEDNEFIEENNEIEINTEAGPSWAIQDFEYDTEVMDDDQNSKLDRPMSSKAKESTINSDDEEEGSSPKKLKKRKIFIEEDE